MSTAERIHTALTEALTPQLLEIQDESHLHRGHVGARDGGGHYRLRIVAEVFEGESLVARQRRVYKALEGAMGGEIHALAMETLTPSEAGSAVG